MNKIQSFIVFIFILAFMGFEEKIITFIQTYITDHYVWTGVIYCILGGFTVFIPLALYKKFGNDKNI